MLPIQVRIERAERLVRMLEQDAVLLAVRFADLAPERRKSAQTYAAQLTACAQAELNRLKLESSQTRRPTRRGTTNHN
ncbi:MAG TPA: hypothetical protein VGF06_12745 [Terriglobales bacterium]|jgi:hypothetical protein